MDGTSRRMAHATTASYGTINAIGVTRRSAWIVALAGHYSHLVQIIALSFMQIVGDFFLIFVVGCFGWYYWR